MTLRAFLIGLLTACFIAGFTYYNNYVLRQTAFIGYFLPPTIFGGLLLALLVVNPVLARIRASWPFTPGELVFMTAMALMAGGLGGSNLGAFFTPNLMLPHYHTKVEAGWNESEMVQRLPDFLLADPGENEEALSGFIGGASLQDGAFGLEDVPWQAWGSALGFWIPVLLFMMVGLLALALVFHRQWAHHEHLPYPVVQIFQKFLPEEDGRLSSIFRTRNFWIGAGVVFAAHINNYAAFINTDLISIPLSVDMSPLLYELPPEFQLNNLRMSLMFPLIFSIIAIGFLIPRGTSFSLAISPWVYNGIVMIMIATGGSWAAGGIVDGGAFLNFGTFCGLALSVFYTGRYYYMATLCSSLKLPWGPKAKDAGVTGEAIFGMRLFFICMIGFNVLLMRAGLDWQLSLTLTAAMVIVYVAFGRVIAETGAVFYNVAFGPAIIVTGMYGTDMVGPEALLLMFFVGAMFFQDPKEALMPFIVNALKFLDVRKISLRRSTAPLVLVLVLGICVVAVTSLYFIYSGGSINIEGRAFTQSSVLPFRTTLNHMEYLSGQGTLETAAAATPLDRLLSIEVFSKQSFWFALGLLLVLGFSAARLRFAWWPFHPILFVVMNSWGAAVCSGPFFIGWFLKTLTLKFGGQAAYRGITPIVLGLMAGEILAIIVSIGISYVMFLITGDTPLPYKAVPI